MSKWRLLILLLLMLAAGGCVPGGGGATGTSSMSGSPPVSVHILVLHLVDGTVNLDEAKGVEGADIFVKELDVRLTTDEKGYATGAIPPGEYTFQVSKSGYQTSVYERGQVAVTGWPNVLWLSQTKSLHWDLSKKDNQNLSP